MDDKMCKREKDVRTSELVEEICNFLDEKCRVYKDNKHAIWSGVTTENGIIPEDLNIHIFVQSLFQRCSVTSIRETKYLTKISTRTVVHPPCNPNLASSDFRLLL